MHQLFAGGAGDEYPNDIRICDAGELDVLLGEASNEVPKRFIGLLAVAPEVPGVAGAHICALEVPDEELDYVGPVMDQSSRKVLQPSPSRVGQMQWQVADDEQIIICAA